MSYIGRSLTTPRLHGEFGRERAESTSRWGLSMLLPSWEAGLEKGHRRQEGQLVRKVVLAAAAWLGASASAFAADKVTLALDWLADPQFGGYYQAVADGGYERRL